MKVCTSWVVFAAAFALAATALGQQDDLDKATQVFDIYPTVTSMCISKDSLKEHRTESYPIDLGFAVRMGKPFDVEITTDHPLNMTTQTVDFEVDEHYDDDSTQNPNFTSTLVSDLGNNHYMLRVSSRDDIPPQKIEKIVLTVQQKTSVHNASIPDAEGFMYTYPFPVFILGKENKMPEDFVSSKHSKKKKKDTSFFANYPRVQSMSIVDKSLKEHGTKDFPLDLGFAVRQDKPFKIRIVTDHPLNLKTQTVDFEVNEEDDPLTKPNFTATVEKKTKGKNTYIVRVEQTNRVPSQRLDSIVLYVQQKSSDNDPTLVDSEGFLYEYPFPVYILGDDYSQPQDLLAGGKHHKKGKKKEKKKKDDDYTTVMEHIINATSFESYPRIVGMTVLDKTLQEHGTKNLTEGGLGFAVREDLEFKIQIITDVPLNLTTQTVDFEVNAEDDPKTKPNFTATIEKYLGKNKYIVSVKTENQVPSQKLDSVVLYVQQKSSDVDPTKPDSEGFLYEYPFPIYLIGNGEAQPETVDVTENKTDTTSFRGYPRVISMSPLSKSLEEHGTSDFPIVFGFAVCQNRPFTIVIKTDQPLDVETQTVDVEVNEEDSILKPNFTASIVQSLGDNTYLVRVETEYAVPAQKLDSIVLYIQQMSSDTDPNTPDAQSFLYRYPFPIYLLRCLSIDIVHAVDFIPTLDEVAAEK